jgi:hypothetical protein
VVVSEEKEVLDEVVQRVEGLVFPYQELEAKVERG